MTIFAVLVALEAAAVVLAVRVATSQDRSLLAKLRNSARSPLVLVLAYALADEVLVEALHRFLFVGEHPVRAAIARHGWPARLAYHLEVAVVVGWPALIAGAAWALFGGSVPPGRSQEKRCGNSLGDGQKRTVFSQIDPGKIRELLFGAWLIVAGGMAACYPLRRGWTAPVLHAVELGFVAVALAAIPAGWRSRAIVTREGQALGIVLVTELAVAVLGAWGTGAGVFTSWDDLARVPYAIGWAVLCVVLIRGQRHADPAPQVAALDRRS